MGHSTSSNTGSRGWETVIGTRILKEWQAREILQRLYQQYRSVRKLAQILIVSKSTLHRILRNEQSVPMSLRARLCEIIPEEELIQILKGKEILTNTV